MRSSTTVMFKGKEVNIALIGDAKAAYLELQKIVKQEQEKGKQGSDHQKIFASIQKTILLLKENPQYGVHIKKKRIPKQYIEKYGVENLWKCDLVCFWRLIYWIDGSDSIKIVSFVLDIVDHKVYDKIFSYKKR